MEAQEPITPAKEWKSKEEKGERFTVPSGNTCLLREEALMAFMRSGAIPNVLMPIVQAAINSEDPAKEIEDLSKQPEFIPGLLEMIDNLVVQVVLQPKVIRPPVCIVCEGNKIVDGLACKQCEGTGEWPERDPEKLYVDEVDFEDRVAISDHVLEKANLMSTFRGKQERNVVAVSDSQDLDMPAVGSSARG